MWLVGVWVSDEENGGVGDGIESGGDCGEFFRNGGEFGEEY